VTKPGCILASNSSTLDIDEFAGARGRPELVLGHHFFSPAHVMKLLEIVRGRATNPETIATSLKLAKQLGKVGVVVGNCFGFVANRMLAYYMREAYLLLEEGGSAAQIDKALTDFGMPMGPFAMQDVAGIDVSARIREYLKSLGKTRADGPQSQVMDRLYEMGRYGQKTGAGWYRYEAGSRTPIADPLIDKLAAQEAAKRGVTRRTVTEEEIIARLRLRSPMRGRECSKTATRFVPAISTSFTCTASGFHATAAVRCSTPTHWDCRPCYHASRRIGSSSALTGSRHRCSSAWSRKGADSMAASLMAVADLAQRGGRLP
jgi:3-hydroxyacyl-CoA dehydrogenase